MHHKIVIKVWAGNSEEGEQFVRDALEDSISAEHNTCGWNYAGDVELITKKMLQTIFKVSTYRELEINSKRGQKEDQDHLLLNLREEILPLLAPLFMNKADAALYVATENRELKEYIEKLFKTRRDIKRPKTFEEIAEAFMKVFAIISKQERRSIMPMWYMEQISKLQRCLDSPNEPSNTLQCSENHYAELPYENKKGLHPYYFLCDRHI